jgi:hypothetical protein
VTLALPSMRTRRGLEVQVGAMARAGPALPGRHQFASESGSGQGQVSQVCLIHTWPKCETLRVTRQLSSLTTGPVGYLQGIDSDGLESTGSTSTNGYSRIDRLIGCDTAHLPNYTPANYAIHGTILS